ncbi:hypothetical protein [Pyrobaculum islandicum]|uniref:hypothetical protein n=1 Tax=Pyrobaculum islandicum TaxID=2277 RepID=UPI000AA97EBD|nr:hypothetical protein [Pyrobaculum islandicum]
MANNVLVLAGVTAGPLLPLQAMLLLAMPIVALTIDAVRRVKQTSFPTRNEIRKESVFP